MQSGSRPKASALDIWISVTLKNNLNARLAQLVERVIDVDDAGGSSPSPRTLRPPFLSPQYPLFWVEIF